MHFQKGSLEAVLGQVGKIVKFRNIVIEKGGFMKAIRYFVAILLFCGLGLGLEAAERPGKEKKEKKPVPEFPFKRFYVDAYAGYGWRLGAVKMNREPFGPEAYLDRTYSMTEGLRVGLDFGYNFNRYLGLEIGGGYMAYINTKSGGSFWNEEGRIDTLFEEDRYYPYYQGIYAYAEARTIDGKVGYGSVQLVVRPGFKRVDPYVKAGLGFVVGKLNFEQSIKVINKEHEEMNDYHSAHGLGAFHEYEEYYTGADKFFKLGFVGALGMDIHLSPLVSLMVEWQFSVYRMEEVSWGNLGLSRVTGKTEAPESSIRKIRYTGRDWIPFGSHGLNFGIKFKF